MSGLANVNSIDAVARLAAAVERYKDETLVALDQLQMEIRHATEWIGHDRKDFWDREVRLGWQRVTEARTELQRRMTYQSVNDHQPACREEKLALEKAKRRLRVAEQKVELVRRWGRAVEHELTECRGAVNQLTSWLESDQPRAAAELHERLRALEAYLAIGVPAELRPGTVGRGSGKDVESKSIEKETPKAAAENRAPKHDEDA